MRKMQIYLGNDILKFKDSDWKEPRPCIVWGKSGDGWNVIPFTTVPPGENRNWKINVDNKSWINLPINLIYISDEMYKSILMKKVIEIDENIIEKIDKEI